MHSHLPESSSPTHAALLQLLQDNLPHPITLAPPSRKGSPVADDAEHIATALVGPHGPAAVAGKGRRGCCSSLGVLGGARSELTGSSIRLHSACVRNLRGGQKANKHLQLVLQHRHPTCGLRAHGDQRRMFVVYRVIAVSVVARTLHLARQLANNTSTSQLLLRLLQGDKC